jgi:hypothetical protein
MDEIFARKEEAVYVPRVRMVTIWLGTLDATVNIDDRDQ